MSRFTDYESAFDAGLELWRRYDLVTPDGVVLASTNPTGGELEWGASLDPLDWTAGGLSQRTSTLKVSGNISELVPSGPDSVLHPEEQNAVRIYATVNGTDVLLSTLAVKTADVVSVSDVVEMTLELVSRSDPLDSEFENRLQYAEGTPIHSLVAEIMGQVMGPVPFSVTETPWVMPVGEFDAGDSRFDKVTKLLTAAGHELADDEEGRIFTRPILPSGDADGERWVYGEDGYPIGAAREVLSNQVPEGVRVVGGSFQNPDRGPLVIVFDTDPTSAGNHVGGGASRIEELKLPMVLSEAQAVDVGYARLRLKGSGPQQVLITVLPNPMLREGDLVDLDYPPLNASGRFRVIGYTLPMEVDAPMRILLRKIFEPRVHYRGSGSDATAGQQVSDDFNRPYENLENLPPPGEPGSPNWTEFGWSWAVVGERAIQRYNGGWSFARYNTPLTSSGHWAEVVAFPKSGHEIGPMIRSESQYNGYSALASINGQVRLVSWSSQHDQTTIATFNYGSDLTGQTVRLEGDQDTLTVYVNGSPIGSTTDNRHHGTYVGMVAYGGSGGSTPAADDFSGGILT